MHTNSYLITNSCHYQGIPWPYDALSTSRKSREAQGQPLFTWKPAFELPIHPKNFRFFLRYENTLKEVLFVPREILTLFLSREWIKQLWCQEVWGTGEDERFSRYVPKFSLGESSHLGCNTQLRCTSRELFTAWRSPLYTG